MPWSQQSTTFPIMSHISPVQTPSIVFLQHSLQFCPPIYKFLCQVYFSFWFPYQKCLCIFVLTKHATRPTNFILLDFITPALRRRHSGHEAPRYLIISSSLLLRSACLNALLYSLTKDRGATKRMCAVERRAANIIFPTRHS